MRVSFSVVLEVGFDDVFFVLLNALVCDATILSGFAGADVLLFAAGAGVCAWPRGVLAVLLSGETGDSLRFALGFNAVFVVLAAAGLESAEFLEVAPAFAFSEAANFGLAADANGTGATGGSILPTREVAISRVFAFRWGELFTSTDDEIRAETLALVEAAGRVLMVEEN